MSDNIARNKMHHHDLHVNECRWPVLELHGKAASEFESEGKWIGFDTLPTGCKWQVWIGNNYMCPIAEVTISCLIHRS